MDEIDNYIEQKIFRLERQKYGIEQNLRVLKQMKSERKPPARPPTQPKQYTIYHMLQKNAV